MSSLGSHVRTVAGRSQGAAVRLSRAIRSHSRPARGPSLQPRNKRSVAHSQPQWKTLNGDHMGLLAVTQESKIMGPQAEVADMVPRVVKHLRQGDQAEAMALAQLDFDDAQTALKCKSTFELARAAAVFQICTIPVIVKNARWMYNTATRMMGQKLPDCAVGVTFFGHFCGGKSSDDIKPIISKLGQNHIGAILDYAVEADIGSSASLSALDAHRQQCDENAEIIFHAIHASAEAASEGGMPGIAAMKITGLGNPQFLERLTAILASDQLATNESVVAALGEWDRAEYEEIMRRVDAIAACAQEKGVMILVDAEQTYMQGAIDHFAIRMMRKYNQHQPVVFNTYQCYLVDAEERVLADLKDAQRNGYHFAAKIVRGAYMWQERALAKERGYTDPIHKTKQGTHDCYDKVVETILEWKTQLPEHLSPSQRALRQRSGLMLATHNEDSVRKCVQKMGELKLEQHNSNVFFGQLQGMCDHVSYTLGQQKFFVYKYLPYGPIREVMPYLLRRAEENSDIMAGAGKEMRLIHEELKRRILGLVALA